MYDCLRFFSRLYVKQNLKYLRVSLYSNKNRADVQNITSTKTKHLFVPVSLLCDKARPTAAVNDTPKLDKIRLFLVLGQCYHLSAIRRLFFVPWSTE